VNPRFWGCVCLTDRVATAWDCGGPGAGFGCLSRHHNPRGCSPPSRRSLSPRVISDHATDPGKDAALVVDGETGKVLYARQPGPGTSSGLADQDDDALSAVRCSQKGTDRPGQHDSRFGTRGRAEADQLHLSAGDTITVENAIKAVVVRFRKRRGGCHREAIGGTEGHFAELMTAKARAPRHARHILPQCLRPFPTTSRSRPRAISRPWRATSPTTSRSITTIFDALVLLPRRRVSDTRQPDWTLSRRRRHQDRLHRSFGFNLVSSVVCATTRMSSAW